MGNNAKQFTHFKTQIDKLTSTMTTLEKETSQWREKSEVKSGEIFLSSQSLLLTDCYRPYALKLIFPIILAECQASAEDEPGDDGEGQGGGGSEEEAGGDGETEPGPQHGEV